MRLLAAATAPLSRRIQVRFSEAQFARLADRARLSGVSIGTLIRLAVGHEDGRADAWRKNEGLPALAAVVVGEHVVQLLETIVPDGRRVSQALRASAMEAAQLRLEELERELEGGRR